MSHFWAFFFALGFIGALTTSAQYVNSIPKRKHKIIAVVSIKFCMAAEKNSYQIANMNHFFMKFSDIMPKLSPFEKNIQ